MKTVIWSIAFTSTLSAAYSAKFRTAGIGTSAPKAKATVCVHVLSSKLGPIFASVRATRSSGFRYADMDWESSWAVDGVPEMES